MLHVPQQGSLYSVSFDRTAVPEALRRSGLLFEPTGAEDDWRQIVVRPRASEAGNPALTLALKTRETDQIFFRRQIPDLLHTVEQINAHDSVRKKQLLRLIPHLGVCLEMSADPGFSAHEEFIEAMTLIARLIDGLFVIPSGFLDCESRELLMMSGTGNPLAQMPAIPDWPAPADETDASAEQAFEPQCDPPDARRVAERMYALTTVAYRGVLDINPERPERAVRLTQLSDWFWSLEIGHELEDAERFILDQPLGGISRPEAQRLSQQFEAVMVLAWSLGLVELPPHDQFVQAKKLADVLGLFQDDTRFAIDSAELRDPMDIRRAADQLMAVHWRLREFEIHPVAVDFAGMARDAWFGPVDLNALPLIDNDLAIGGRPIALADPALRLRSHAAIQWRHRAINWLCGHHPKFSQVDIST